jgi:hypothetical protein
VILATIRADATVASKVDCFLSSTGFTLVCEEAASLVLAGQHLVDFLDFDFAEVISFRKAKCRPVVIVLEYVFNRERGIRSKTEENDDEICSGCEDVQVHQLDIMLEGITINAEGAQDYSLYPVNPCKSV